MLIITGVLRIHSSELIPYIVEMKNSKQSQVVAPVIIFRVPSSGSLLQGTLLHGRWTFFSFLSFCFYFEIELCSPILAGLRTADRRAEEQIADSKVRSHPAVACVKLTGSGSGKERKYLTRIAVYITARFWASFSHGAAQCTSCLPSGFSANSPTTCCEFCILDMLAHWQGTMRTSALLLLLLRREEELMDDRRDPGSPPLATLNPVYQPRMRRRPEIS